MVRCSGCGALFDPVWRWCPDCGDIRAAADPFPDAAEDFTVEWILDLTARKEQVPTAADPGASS